MCTWYSEHCQALLTCLVLLSGGQRVREDSEWQHHLSIRVYLLWNVTRILYFGSWSIAAGCRAESILRDPRSDLRIPRRGCCCAAWCHMEAHAAPPPHKLHIRCCVLFSHSTFMLFSSPAPVVQISISALYVPCRYLSTYLCQTYLSELGVEKSWNATRPHQTSAKAKKSTCKKNEINTHTSTVTVFSKRSVLQNQDLVLLPEIVMQAVISPRRGWPLPCCT